MTDLSDVLKLVNLFAIKFLLNKRGFSTKWSYSMQFICLENTNFNPSLGQINLFVAQNSVNIDWVYGSRAKNLFLAQYLGFGNNFNDPNNKADYSTDK